MKYKFKFSVIIPVYNVADYIGETIQSVIDQTIGFEKNIQIILVNDGSTDQSEEVCLKYKEQYPDNIIYVKQKNAGVSVARNLGIQYIEGKYVNFLDSDDLWEKQVFKRVWTFFEKHRSKIDVVACRIKCFEASKSYHPLDFKFKEDKIVDIAKDFGYIQLNGPTVFVKNEVLKNNKFEIKLKYGEDPYWVNKIILEKGKYGIKADCLYLYRKRFNTDSSQDNNVISKDYYIDTLNLYLKRLYNYTNRHHKPYLKYIESLILYEIYWKIKIAVPKDVLNEEEMNLYLHGLYQLLNKIDNDVIVMHPFINIYFKIYFLQLKNGKKFKDHFQVTNRGIRYDKAHYFDQKLFNNITFFKFRVVGDKLIVHGRLTPIICDTTFKFYIEDKNTKEKIQAKLYKIKNWNTYASNGDLITKIDLFKLEIPIKNIPQFYESYVTYGKTKIKTTFKISTPYSLSNKYKQYKIVDKKCMINRQDDGLVITKYTFFAMLKKECICLWDLLKKHKLKTLCKRLLKPLINFKNALIRLIPLKNIIILESNPDFTDNAKALFDLMIKNNVNDKYKIVWFVRDPEEFKDIHIKNVEFLHFFGLSKAQRDAYTEYCYNHAKIILDGNKYVKKRKQNQIRIHLNHGSPFKNALHYNLNIGEVNYNIVQSKFFIPVESEVRDMDPKKIIPLGFPRNDVLYEKQEFRFDKLDKLKTKKTILWLPTYRNHSSLGSVKNKLRFGLSCVETDKELLALNACLKEKNVTLLIKFHPAEKLDLLENFKLSNIVILKDSELEEAQITLYQLFSKVDALITDYSSVYFDFCLTKKNIGLAISDIDSYIKEQGDFQYNYKDAIVGNYMYTNKDLLEFIEDVAEGRDRTYDKRMELVNRYDDYQDGKATERVYDFIKKFL